MAKATEKGPPSTVLETTSIDSIFGHRGPANRELKPPVCLARRGPSTGTISSFGGGPLYYLLSKKKLGVKGLFEVGQGLIREKHTHTSAQQLLFLQIISEKSVVTCFSQKSTNLNGRFLTTTPNTTSPSGFDDSRRRLSSLPGEDLFQLPMEEKMSGLGIPVSGQESRSKGCKRLEYHTLINQREIQQRKERSIL
ncbi:hypothetical protein RND71_035626 [Anisodus tanguticus]|uniref:Uncharacterized protein n=1 Tax=Anisodus tanguticus TaxID=243964 RepID=A0AAE1R5D4_9SOLA|nr:hypothetical protein RND71_035626 [Anisodus tanguticus]